jgi:hypothetical protein
MRPVGSLREVAGRLVVIICSESCCSLGYRFCECHAVQEISNSPEIPSLELANRLAACADEANPKTAAPRWLIAFRDHTVEPQPKYWTEGFMLHYKTSHGSHVHVRWVWWIVDFQAAGIERRHPSPHFLPALSPPPIPISHLQIFKRIWR